ILVATGGGVIGRALLDLAARASALSTRPWRLRVGGPDAAAQIARLSALGPAIAEPAAPDYRARLAGAAASISLCGYNTAVETALAGTPALLVPMEEKNEQEQLIRAAAFARLPELETARLADLTPETLAARAEALAAAPRRSAALKADGAAEAARLFLKT
ncbi:MAG: glycosyltransferase, partial [Pseudomonadota bacterium]